MKHRETHPDLDVEGCFGCRVASVRFSDACSPTRKPHIAERIDEHRQFTRDAQAVKDLARQGLCPPRVDGAADLAARAETSYEIRSGNVLTPEKRRRLAPLIDAVSGGAA